VLLAELTYTASATVSGMSPVKAGAHQVAAIYSGDANYSGSPSNIVALTGSAPSVAVVPALNSLTISQPGGTASTTIAVSSVQGFSGSVNLVCQVTYSDSGTATDLPTCSLTPQQANLTASSPLTSTLTVASTAASSSLHFKDIWPYSDEVLAAMVFFVVLPIRRRKRLPLFLVSTMIAIFLLAGCGGASQGTKSTPSPGTTKGNYKIMVTASGSADPVSSTITMSLQ
jgi:hypothetical protein